MMLCRNVLPFFVAVFVLANNAPGFDSVRFQRVLLSEEFHSEGAAFADINGDSHNDVVSGPYWYQGPEFSERHAYAPVQKYSTKGYSDHFFSFTRDFNRDGHVDILSIPIPGGQAVWYQNPGETSDLWVSHLVLDDVGNESPTLVDITGDGVDDLVCVQAGQFGYAEANPDAAEDVWRFTPASENRGYGRFTHGLGVGDVDGDGRLDLLGKDGWWQQTGTSRELFQFHETKFAESGGSQMFVYDFDGDGDNDVVSVQNAHAYGLCWFERRGVEDDFLFVRHQILGSSPADNPYGLAISQMHALALADVDGDGIKDLVMGKRYWAHGGADPGADELPVLYWLKTVRENAGVRFEPHLISRRVGVGTQLTVADIDGNGHVDIVVGNKLGTYVLFNSGASELPPQPSKTARHIVGTDEFRSGVRSTDPMSPDEQRATFVLPAGFEAQLVAAEPDIAKPMNMAFDHRGRLWVSSSIEYPYAAANGEGRDTIKILEDTNDDGRADRITTFADGLNIPIGLYPYGDGVICHSIPNIWYLRDTDGDDVADKREMLFGPFDNTRDTHGMCNGFTRGYDGWLYACHGFNNESSVAGRDGHRVTMHSGNTFRMRLDGSRIEHFTHGQVNPFGMAIDPNGDFYTADCHTKPITLLMRGGFYESFGKPHDGLGFVPDVMEHLHGSTAIGGIALYHANHFPPIFRGNSFGGNVMTSRVNRNSVHHAGASVRAQEESDFLISGDPWFRPVDLKVGPDGALYVADFYNRVIGHYEVPLDHPGRDRHRGRIWRIVFNGPEERRDLGSDPREENPSESDDDFAELVSQLRSPSLSARMLATDQLSDGDFSDVGETLRREYEKSTDPNSRIHLLWILHRRSQLSDAALNMALRDENPRVRNHAYQVLGESEIESGRSEELLSAALTDSDPLALRSAVMASIQHPSLKFISPLMHSYYSTPEGDVHLRHAIRMSLREHLKNPVWFRSATDSINRRDAAVVFDLCLALKTDFAGEFVASRVGEMEALETEKLAEYLEFSARYASIDHLHSIAEMAQARFSDDAARQEQFLRAVHEGIQQRGDDTAPVIIQWANRLARRYIGMSDSDQELARLDQSIQWTAIPLSTDQVEVWHVSKKRDSADGEIASLLYSSFPGGESRTGVYRSDEFTLPNRFSFFLAGHDGFPDQPLQHRNLVRIRDAKTREVLNQWSPPRNDIAQTIHWDTGESASRPVFIELVDGDTANAYAWLAAGRFSVTGLNPSDAHGDRRRAAALVSDFQLKDLRRPMEQLLLSSDVRREAAAAYARAIAALNPSGIAWALAESVSIDGVDRELRATLNDALLGRKPIDALEILASVMKVSTAAEQKRVAQELSSDRKGIDVLITLVEQGSASPRLLVDSAIAPSISTMVGSEQASRIERLVGDLPAEDTAVPERILQTKSSYVAKPGDANRGVVMFGEQCGICHQVAGKGTVVGPNLDGIGNRGLDRVLEDILAPNRNIDAAFQSTVVLTDDGRVISGLAKEREGERLVLVDQKGKEVSIPVGRVVEQKRVRTSPMPNNFHETLDDSKMRDLLAYLLSLAH